MSLMKLDLLLSILRTFFEAEAETLIPPLVFASVMMLKPAFHRWRFKIVRAVDLEDRHYTEPVYSSLAIFQYSGQNLSRFQTSNPDSTVDRILLSKSGVELTLIK